MTIDIKSESHNHYVNIVLQLPFFLKLARSIDEKPPNPVGKLRKKTKKLLTKS